ncbi:unnamed protein product [Thelazia callipaeda]|uniref:Nidogen G2 beta-barrel domain-containing protein n=1 Tax=Thelazia callipaeda TaxID=103827 RepID=A0A0N5CRG8_THECL|nr:unnamed protein product [Thelazia callipaeda]
MFLLLLLYCITFLKTICLGADLYDFGIDKGDQELPFSKDDYGITLDVPIIYFEESQNELFISSSGAVTFGKSVDMSRITNLDDEKISAVAIFFVPTESGKIFYRATSSDETLLRDLSSKIRKNFPNRESSEFTALHAVVITWNDMVGKDSAESSNQFQVMTDGISSYAFLIYNQLDWTGEGGQQAQAGLYFSDGRRETMVNSGTVSIKELVNLSNNQNEGTYIFRISGSSPEDPRGAISEDDYSYNDYEPEYDPDNEENKQQKECPPDPYRDQCPSECQVLTDDRGCSLCVCTRLAFFPFNFHFSDIQNLYFSKIQSNILTYKMNLLMTSTTNKLYFVHYFNLCIDYNPGYCCECLSGYYGNGEECLRNGEPQRINGAFEGVVNGEEIGRAELHTYVMVEEGRSYTALSQIPRHLGPSLLLVNVIGGAMGWLFAKVVSPTSYNGFMLTGGLFNRTVNVRIGDRYAVTIKQQFSGRDIYHYFKAHMFISGTLPKISDKSEVSYDDYEEEYRREGPGFLRSYSSQLVTVKENSEEKQMKLSIDQQISYKECSFKEFTRDSVVVIQVTRPHVVYDAEEHIVRYASANIATKKEADTAVPHSANSDTYSMLEGNRGHEQGRQHQGQVEEQILKNPCETGRHLCKLPNMICTPFERSYHCECVKGYHAERDSTVELGWKCRGRFEFQFEFVY